MKKNLSLYILGIIIVVCLALFGIFSVVHPNNTNNSSNNNNTTDETWFSVTFDYRNENEAQQVLVYENGFLLEPEVPEKDGYLFKYWELNGSKFDFQTPITKNIVLTAKWEEYNEDEGTIYTVVFDSNGGSNIGTQKVKENERALVPSVPYKNGYKFAGWQLNGYMYDFNSKVTDDIILKALWQKIESSNNNTFQETKVYYYTVYLKIYEDFTTIYKTIEQGQLVPKPSDPMKIGYEFVEWQLNGQKYNFDTPLTSDITLTAVYKKVEKTYVITFDGNGGEVSFTQKIIKYGNYGEMPTATRDGYEFIGWSTVKEGGFTPIREDDLIQKLEDHTLYARWEKQQ